MFYYVMIAIALFTTQTFVYYYTCRGCAVEADVPPRGRSEFLPSYRAILYYIYYNQLKFHLTKI